jgi:hypothetical protein
MDKQTTRKLLTASINELLEADDVEQRCKWMTTAPRRPLGDLGGGDHSAICKKREDQGASAVANFPPAAARPGTGARSGGGFLP